MRLLLLALFVCLAWGQYDGPSQTGGGYATPKNAKHNYEATQNNGGSSPPNSKALRKHFKIIEQKIKCGGDYVSSPDDQYFMQNYQEIKQGFTNKVQQAPPQVQSDFISSVSRIASVATTFFSLFQSFMGIYQSFTSAFSGLGISYDAAGDDTPEWEKRLNAALATIGKTDILAPPAPPTIGSEDVVIAADAPRNRPGLDIPPPPSEDHAQPMPVAPYQPPAPSPPSYGQKPPPGPKPSPHPAKPSYTKNGSAPSKPKPSYVKPKPGKTPSYGTARSEPPSKPKPNKPSYVKPKTTKPKSSNPTYTQKNSKPYKPKPSKPSYVQKNPKPHKPKPSKPSYGQKGPKPYKPKPNKPSSGPQKEVYKPVKKEEGYPTAPRPLIFPAPPREDTPYDVPDAAADAPKKKKKPAKKPAPKKKPAQGKVVGAKQKQNVNVKGGKVYTVVKAPRYIDLYVPAAYSPEQTAAAYAAALQAAQRDSPDNPLVLPPPPPGVQMTVSGVEDIPELNNTDESDATEEDGPAPPPTEVQDTGYKRH